MPAPINQENFYTVRAVPSPARPLFTNLNHLPLTTVMRPPSGEGNDNARSITEIQERLADANEAFRARRFGDALAAYQATAELIDALPAAAAAPAAGNDLGRFNRGRFDGVMTRVSVLARELYGARPSLNVVGHVVNRASDGTVRPNDVVASLYDVRRAQNSALNLRWAFDTPAAFALQLPHIREFVIPLCQGDCYHALGDFPRARDAFLQVASYPYLNAAIEAPLLWKRLAQNYLDWGDSLFRNDLSADALAIYSQVVGHASTPDVGSPLYVSQSLKPIGDKVRIALAAAGAAADPAFDALNPEIARIVCETRSRVLMIDSGLDWLGMSVNDIPVWTFDYLQTVARYFTQQAIHAERDYVAFRDHADAGTLTRTQLESAVTVAGAEMDLATRQVQAAAAERDAYAAGRNLARLRWQNAQQNRQDYGNMSWDRIYVDADIAYYGAPMYDVEGGGRSDEVIYEKSIERGKLVRDYEMGAMQRTVAELQAAENVAAQQLQSANARVSVANEAVRVARFRQAAASESLRAFDAQTFTPDVWGEMAEFVRRTSRSYLDMATRTARLMQRAYNFEFDDTRSTIRTDYASAGVAGLLGGDALMLDIDAFTFEMISSGRGKVAPVKQTISLADRYAYQFEREFRPTGVMAFTIRMEDLDLAFPGTLAHRIAAVEVEVDGVLPERGAVGTLSNEGVSLFRTTDPAVIKTRIQPAEQWPLSEYQRRGDSIMFRADTRALGIFEGAGVAGTWRLEIPRATNDLDYASIADVRITFYYEARVDAALGQQVAALLRALPGSLSRSRTYPLRWAFSDAFYAFLNTGVLDFDLTAAEHFAANETQPVIQRIALLIVPAAPGLDLSTLTVHVTAPGKAAESAALNAAGSVASGGGRLNASVGGTALGHYTAALPAEDNASLVVDGAPRYDRIDNVILILEYSYTARV